MRLTYIIQRTWPLLLVLTLSGCKKLVETASPVTSVSGANVYNDDATAAAVLTGIYTKMSYWPLVNGVTLSSFMTLYPGVGADELTMGNVGSNSLYLLRYYRNSLSNSPSPCPWDFQYPVIFVCNSAIEALSNSSGSLTPSIRQQLLGEAKFMRAFSYFYLTNLYGDVPLVLSTDYNVSSLMARTAQETVYQQIIADLKDAQSLLSADYLNADIVTTTGDRLRPTKWAATALLARTYLYHKEWANAEAQTDSVISNVGQFQLAGLKNVFLRAGTVNQEAIWQLQPVNTGWNTEDARLFVIPSTGLSYYNPVYLSNNLLSSFETGDLRKTNWVDTITVGGTLYYFPYKYKVNTINNDVTEYQMVLRLAEQYLIRAEARAQQNKITGADGALADLNVIRGRAGLSAYAGATDQASVLAAILHENQIEFFVEWGHRWLDLKRTNTIDSVMSVVTPQKGGTWNANWQWYPIILSDLTADPNLKQNQGY